MWVEEGGEGGGENDILFFNSDVPTQSSWNSSRSAPPQSKGRARGRIAEVLAQARASLKEPSRPHTPASLDARTSIDLTNSMRSSRHGLSSVTASSSSSSTSSTASSVTSKKSIHSVLSEGLRSSLGDSQRITDENAFLQQYADPSNDYLTSRRQSSTNSSVSSSSSSSISVTTSSSSQNQSVHLLLCDMKDTLSTLESASLPGGKQLDFDHLRRVLEGFGVSVEKLSKILKGGASLSTTTLKEINNQLGDLTCVLLRFVNIKCPADVKQLVSRYILRLQLSRVHRITNGSSAGAVAPLPVDLANAVLSTTQCMYQICTQEEEGKNANGSSIANKLKGNGNNGGGSWMGGKVSASFDNGLAPEYNTCESDEDNDGNEGFMMTSTASDNTNNSVMLQGGIDLLLELLSQVWQRLPRDFSREMDSEQRSNHTSSAGKEYGSLIMLESAVFAAGILRIYSNDEVNRRRLIHLGVIEIISDGLRAAGSVTSFRAKERKAQSIGGTGDISTSSSSSSSCVSPLQTK